MKIISVISMILILSWDSNLFAASFGDREGNNKHNDVHYSLLSNAPLLNSKSNSESYPSKALYLNLSPDFSRIYNKSIYNDEKWQQKDGGIGYNIEFGYFMKFKKFIGFGIGLGYSTYQTEIGLNSYKETLPSAPDIDGDNRKLIIEVSDLAQKTQLSYIDLPVYLEFGNPNTYKLNFYGRIGVKFSYPVLYKFTTGGSFSTQGNYEKYFVLLYGINNEDLGLYDNEQIEAVGETALNPLNISAILSLGMTIPASDRLIFKIGANINYGLMEISADKYSNDDFTKSSLESNSLLMEPGSNTITQSVGLEIGIIYILQSKF